MALKNIDTILYASDLDGHDGREAFRVAASNAIAHHAKLIFLNVMEPLNPMAQRAVSHCFSDTEIEGIENQGYQRVKADIVERINSFVESELEGGIALPFAPQVLVEKGMPAKTIVKAAMAANADMIVMGTRSRNKMSQVMLGSTAHQVLFHAKCPVLVIPIWDQ